MLHRLKGRNHRSTAVASQARRRRGVRLPAWLRPHQFFILYVLGVLGFLACQSHENTWWLLAWFGGYLAVLKARDRKSVV